MYLEKNQNKLSIEMRRVITMNKKDQGVFNAMILVAAIVLGPFISIWLVQSLIGA